MLDLWRSRQQDEGIKRFGGPSLAKAPISYYREVRTELSPEILWIGSHIE
jgi:hypothetical protein